MCTHLSPLSTCLSPVSPLAIAMPEAPSLPNKGPRKCKPSKRVTENGDPLAKKKSRTTNLTATQSSTGSSASSTTPRSANVAAPVSPPCAQPHTQPHAAIDAETTEDPLSDPEPIEVLDSDSGDSVELIEDDDMELGACSHIVFNTVN
jgi:hypothetical protein